MKKLIVLIAVLALAIVVGWYELEQRPFNAESVISKESQTLTVQKGMSTTAIAALLERERLIRSARVFRVYARLHGSSLKAGTYDLAQWMDVPEIVKILEEGKVREISITIPEGFTVTDIDALLVSKGLIKEGEAVRAAQDCHFGAFHFIPPIDRLARRGGCVEGYLFADTYNVEPTSFSLDYFLGAMLTRFKEVMTDKSVEIEASGHSMHQIITMASLIEEETRTAEERPIVAGILWKRLDQGITLGVDASVRYIVNKPTSAITKADLEIDSPYNLRKHQGLPPGPIASPSLSSIQAALHPKDSPYFYYLHDKNGVIHYARTNEEHNQNRAKYLSLSS